MSDQNNALALHNQARAAVGVAPLQWDNGLQNAAQAWANHLAAIDSLDHDPNAGAGENIALIAPVGDGILAGASTMWINELQKGPYVYGVFDGSNVEAIGHYTQIVWANTTNVGMASATSSTGTGYVVARYSPQGNVIGQYPYPQGAPANPGFEGVFLLNVSSPSGDQRSGVGWYRNALQAEGHSPDPPLDAAGVGRGWIPWEGSQQSVTFPDGDVFTWNINANAQSQPDYTLVGTAHNNYRSFDVFSDNKRVLYTQNGSEFRTIYYCK